MKQYLPFFIILVLFGSCKKVIELPLTEETYYIFASTENHQLKAFVGLNQDAEIQLGEKPIGLKKPILYMDGVFFEELVFDSTVNQDQSISYFYRTSKKLLTGKNYRLVIKGENRSDSSFASIQYIDPIYYAAYRFEGYGTVNIETRMSFSLFHPDYISDIFDVKYSFSGPNVNNNLPMEVSPINVHPSSPKNYETTSSGNIIWKNNTYLRLEGYNKTASHIYPYYASFSGFPDYLDSIIVDYNYYSEEFGLVYNATHGQNQTESLFSQFPTSDYSNVTNGIGYFYYTISKRIKQPVGI